MADYGSNGTLQGAPRYSNGEFTDVVDHGGKNDNNIDANDNKPPLKPPGKKKSTYVVSKHNKYRRIRSCLDNSVHLNRLLIDEYWNKWGDELPAPLQRRYDSLVEEVNSLAEEFHSKRSKRQEYETRDERTSQTVTEPILNIAQPKTDTPSHKRLASDSYSQSLAKRIKLEPETPRSLTKPCPARSLWRNVDEELGQKVWQRTSYLPQALPSPPTPRTQPSLLPRITYGLNSQDQTIPENRAYYPRNSPPAPASWAPYPSVPQAQYPPLPREKVTTYPSMHKPCPYAQQVAYSHAGFPPHHPYQVQPRIPNQPFINPPSNQSFSPTTTVSTIQLIPNQPFTNQPSSQPFNPNYHRINQPSNQPFNPNYYGIYQPSNQPFNPSYHRINQPINPYNPSFDPSSGFNPNRGFNPKNERT